MLNSLIILIVGWLLGLLAPVIVDAIKNRREVTKIYVAIRSELNEAAYRMTLASYATSTHLGVANHEFLKWVKDSLFLYQGQEPKESVIKTIEGELLLTPELLASINAASAAKGLEALVLVRFAVPFIDTRISAFHLMPSTLQLQLLSIRADVNLLDDLVNQSKTYFQLTFGKLEDGNHSVVVKNLRGVYDQYIKRCRITADRIHHLESVL